MTARIVRSKSKARLLQQSRNTPFHLQECSASYDAVTVPFFMKKCDVLEGELEKVVLASMAKSHHYSHRNIFVLSSQSWGRPVRASMYPAKINPSRKTEMMTDKCATTIAEGSTTTLQSRIMSMLR